MKNALLIALLTLVAAAEPTNTNTIPVSVTMTSVPPARLDKLQFRSRPFTNPPPVTAKLPVMVLHNVIVVITPTDGTFAFVDEGQLSQLVKLFPNTTGRITNLVIYAP